MISIRNKEELLNDAFSSTSRMAREIALDCIEALINAVEPKKIVKSKIFFSNNILKIGEKTFDMTHYDEVIVVGGGKASGSMAEALEEILGNRITKGLVVVPRGSAKNYHTKKIRIHEASHPIPDESSVEGAKKIIGLVRQAKENDLVICLISGGGSSLLALPRDGVSLSDKQEVTELLLKCGATINEINAVRKHISNFKGGQLAKAAYPATVLGLLLSDVLGDPLDVIASGPTVPDSTTFKDAVRTLKRYNAYKKIPESIKEVLSKGEMGLLEETPKKDDPIFNKVCNIVLGNNRLASQAAVNLMKDCGLKVLFLSSFIEGEARELGKILGAIAKESFVSGNPFLPPFGIVVGGETTVTVTGKGKGGRNQEIALAASLMIEGLNNTVIASVSTDGIDGPTDAAGAIVSSETLKRCRELKIDASEYLKNNDSYSFFSKVGGLIFTGPTGTNVNDVTILIVL